MSDKEYLTKRRLDLIAGIASKVRQDAYVAFQKTGKQKYRRIDAPITSQAHRIIYEVVKSHVYVC